MTNADKSPSFDMTWGSSTSSGYCSEEDSEDPEYEQYFTARTSFFPRARKDNAKADVNVKVTAKKVRLIIRRSRHK